MRSFDVYTRPLRRSTDFSAPQTAVLFVLFPLLYNHVFLIGVMNYMFGLGLVLWALAVWVWLRERMWPLRLVVSAIFVLALFVCHLFAVALYGMGLFAIELHRLWESREDPW